MNARRLGALLVAIALVAGAFAVRSRIDKLAELDRVPLRVACAAELGAACDRLRERGYEVVVEEAQVTARRLALQTRDDLDTELWLTVEPAAALVNTDRALRGVDALFAPNAVTPVATTDLALVVWTDRAEVLRKACPTLTFRCVGEVAGRGAWTASGGRANWGQVRIALPDPEETATGLLALGGGAQSWFGRADIASNDFDADPSFGDWLAGLARAAPADGSLPRMMAVGRAALDMAIAPRAVADTLTRGADVVTLTLSPETAVSAVAVVLPGSRGQARDITSALGWRARPAGTGQRLPADVLEALRLRWRELSR